jgi:hypothetical protein
MMASSGLCNFYRRENILKILDTHYLSFLSRYTDPDLNLRRNWRLMIHRCPNEFFVPRIIENRNFQNRPQGALESGVMPPHSKAPSAHQPRKVSGKSARWRTVGHGNENPALSKSRVIRLPSP